MGRIFHKLVPETGTEGGWWDLGELYVHITSAMSTRNEHQAAFVEANKPEDETLAITDAIEQFMETQKEFHEQRACQDERGREWLKTIGRRALQSLAPRKSLRAKPHGSDRDHRVI
ncbi:unnamed protein product [Penicillium viridicatum]